MSSLNRDHKKTTVLLASSANDLAEAAHILRHGGIVALPTETVYGLAANGLSSQAIARIFAAKNRPLNNPLIFHVKDQHRAKNLFDFSGLNPQVAIRFELLAASFWPGPLTMIAKKAPHIPKIATGNLASVAVRVPESEATRTIMGMLDFPLVMPSANLSTRPSPTCAEHVIKTLCGRIDAVVDGGTCDVGIESTIIKIDAEEVQILRPGMIDNQELEACLKEKVRPVTAQHHERPLAPGQSYLHYSPSVFSVELRHPSQITDEWHGEHIIFARTSDFLALEKERGERAKSAINILLSDDAKQYAAELYDALYACERSPEKTLVIISPPPDGEEWRAILDRLTRSAGVGQSPS